jgi:hypothetical protein
MRQPASKSSRFSVLLVICVSTCLFGIFIDRAPAQTPSQADQPDRIHGTVINTVTHEPIARALVYSQDNRVAAFTDDRGHFDLPLPRPDMNPTLFGTASADGIQRSVGFAQLQTPVVLAARKPGFLPPASMPNGFLADPAQPNLVVRLVPEGRIVGRVALPGSGDIADYAAVAPIRVTLLYRTVNEGRERWEPLRQVEARSNGDFRFFNLFAGTYRVLTDEALDRDPQNFAPNAQVYGFPPAFFPVASDADSSASIHVSPGETIQATLTLTRREYYDVRLPVLNAPANTLFDVLVWPVGHPGLGYSLGYDLSRNAVRGMLPDGTYTVMVLHSEGSATGTATITVHGARVTAPSIAVVPNPSISVVVHEELAKSRTDSRGDAPSVGGSISSHIEFNGYQFTLMPEDGYALEREITASMISDQQPLRYVFGQVPPGRYRVKVFSQASYTASIRAGGTDLLRESLVVGIGSAPPEIDVTVRDDGGSVSGELVARESQDGSRPLSGIAAHSVYFLPVSGTGVVSMAWATPDGKFALENLAPGTYNVLGFDRPQGDLERSGEIHLHGYESQVQQITIAPGQAQTLRVPMIEVPE